MVNPTHLYGHAGIVTELKASVTNLRRRKDAAAAASAGGKRELAALVLKLPEKLP